MKKRTLVLLFALFATSLYAARPVQHVEVPFNVGIGPTLFWLPGIAGREFHTGFNLSLYGVITPQALENNKEKIPLKYRRYLNTMREIHLAPLWMILVPQYVIVSPASLGEDDAVYGAIWSLLSVGPEFISKRRYILEGKFSPTISFLHVDSDDNEDSENLLGIGCTLSLVYTYEISDHVLISVSYAHLLQLPLSINSYKPNDATSEHWIQGGALSLTLNIRFGMEQKL